MIVINNLQEAEEFLNHRNETHISFQSIEFYSLEAFQEFINDLKQGVVLQMPKNTSYHKFYCNFGLIYCDTLVITKSRLIFFDNNRIIFMKTRNKYDDISMCFNKSENCHCSVDPLVYDDELDTQFENYGLYPKYCPDIIG